MLLSGRLLLSRGAVIPGLAALGWPRRPAGVPGRLWRMASGTRPSCWRRRSIVQEERSFTPPGWGLSPCACDLVRLLPSTAAGCPTKHYSSARARPYPPSRWVSPPALGRSGPASGGPLLARTASRPAERNASQLACSNRLTRGGDQQSADLRSRVTPPTAPGSRHPTLVVRAPINFTARRRPFPPYQGKGRKPGRGALVRPSPYL